MTARPCLGRDDAILRADELLLLGHQIYIYPARTRARFIVKKEQENVWSLLDLIIERDKRHSKLP